MTYSQARGGVRGEKQRSGEEGLREDKGMAGILTS